MGKHTRAQITEPIASGAEPFWAGPPEWILQRQIHRGGGQEAKSYHHHQQTGAYGGGMSEHGPQTHNTWHLIRDNCQKKLRHPRSHWRARDSGGPWLPPPAWGHRHHTGVPHSHVHTHMHLLITHTHHSQTCLYGSLMVATPTNHNK